MIMKNKEKIKKLENLLEYAIMIDNPAFIQSKTPIDITRHIDSLVSLQNTITDLRNKQFLKDKNIYTGDIE